MLGGAVAPTGPPLAPPMATCHIPPEALAEDTVRHSDWRKPHSAIGIGGKLDDDVKSMVERACAAWFGRSVNY
jgi:hypothetical protein